MAGEEEITELPLPLPQAGEAAEVAPESVPEPTAEVTPEPQEDVVAIKADLKRERQRSQKLAQRLSALGQVKARLENLAISGRASSADEKRLDGVEEMLAEIMDRLPSEEDTASSRSYRKELQERRQAKTAVEKTRSEAYAAGLWRPVERALIRAGVPTEKVTQNPEFLSLWNSGKFDEAQELALDLIDNPGKKPVPELSAQAEEESEVEKETRQKQEEQAKRKTDLRASGALKNERGGGGPASLTVREILDKPIPTNLSPQETEEYKKLLLSHGGVKG